MAPFEYFTCKTKLDGIKQVMKIRYDKKSVSDTSGQSG